MSKEINPQQAKNLEYLKREEHLTQVQIAELLNVSQQQVSRILRGVSPLQYDHARAIQKAYPQYLISWLMGDSEDKTSADSAKRFDDEQNALISGLTAYANAAGYQFNLFGNEVIIVDRFGEETTLSKEDKAALIDDIVGIVGSLLSTRIMRSVSNTRVEEIANPAQ